jgi:mannose-1-phosphate guanylyltransferase
MMAQVRSFPHRDVPRSPDAAHLWGIILAGPAGPLSTDFGRDRLARLGRRARLGAGDDVFGETLRRASRLIADDRLVAVLTRADLPAYADDLAARPCVRRLVQPRYRGSAAEIFLPILAIAREDPEATVVVLPADHLVGRDGRLMEHVARAACAASWRPDLPLLVAARARRGEATYGWIEPGDPVDGLESLSIRAVKRFVHDRSTHGLRWIGEPAPSLSTVAIVAKARALVELGERYVPEVLETLEPLAEAVSAKEAALLCEAIYECMPYASVSRELLERGHHFGVLAVPDVAWGEADLRAALLAS